MTYQRKCLIKSFKIPEGFAAKEQIETACERLLQEKRKDLKAEGKTPDMSYEVIDTMGSIRVNLYDATDFDAVLLGHHIAMLKMMDMKPRTNGHHAPSAAS